MLRRLLPAVLVLLLAVAPAARAQLVGDATVRLALRAALTGLPVPEAAVRLESMGRGETFERLETADARGRVVFTDVPVGMYRVEVLPPGHAAETFTLVVPLGGEVEQELALALAVPLPAVTVEGERIHAALQRRGFYERRAQGFGRHYTREQILATNPTRLSDALARIPNVRVRTTMAGTAVLNLTATDTRAGGTCVLDVFVDGVEVMTPEGFFDGDMVPVDDVLGLEVYLRGTHVPMEYRRGRGCGAVLVWTGHPERRR